MLGCVLAWFMIGLHWPAVHQMTHHGQSPSLTVLGALSVLAVAGLAGLWRLLRIDMDRESSLRGRHG